MGANLKQIPLSTLLTLQQLVEFGSADISNLFFKAMEEYQENKISERYFQELENKLEKRLEKNNDAVELIGSEILKRVKKTFPDVSTTESMSYVRKAHDKELEAYAKIYKSKTDNKPKEDKPVIKPAFNISREKKV